MTKLFTPLILLVIVCVVYAFGVTVNHTEIWIIKSDSSLKVDGKTNINSFTCLISSYGKADTLVCDKNMLHSSLFNLDGNIKIEVSQFDCKHRVMTKDLQKTLKSGTYPYMIVKFKSLSKLPSEADEHTEIVGDVEIELAGIRKSFSVHYAAKVTNKDNIELVGTRRVLFSDFSLKPPSKLGGVIKVKNELDVSFTLLLKKIK